MPQAVYKLSQQGREYLCNPNRNQSGRIQTTFFQDVILIFIFLKGGYTPSACKRFYETFGVIASADKEQMRTRDYSKWKQYMDAAKQQLLKKKILEKRRTGYFEIPREKLGSAFNQVSDYLELCSLAESTSVISREFELKWRLGARTTALITGLTRQFESNIEITIGAESADAKSIMSVMMVSSREGQDVGLGCRVKVEASGVDANSAINALTELFTCGARVERCIEPTCLLKPALAGYTADTVSYGCKNNHVWSVRRIDAF